MTEGKFLSDENIAIREPRPLAKYLMSRGGRDEGVLRAVREGGYTQIAIARALDLSVSRISRVIQAGEAKDKTP